MSVRTLLLLFAVAITAYAGFTTWLILRYRSRGGVVVASIHLALICLVAGAAFVAYFVRDATHAGVLVIFSLLIFDLIYRRFLGPRLFPKP
jgi:hypothetical protein